MDAVPRNSPAPPNLLFVMTDQQRFDTIAALGASPAITPNLDRLVRRGFALTNAYATCPVCVPARYGIMTGREPSLTGWFSNWQERPDVVANCGSYLAQNLAARGYRTFGLGKFHTEPRNEPLGFEVHEYSEELWASEEEYLNDDYVRWLRGRTSAFNHLEQVHGERTDMYYGAQSRPQPAELCGEAWLAQRASEEIGRVDPRPYFGFVSFVQPHPPIAPPIPYNRLFNPDDMRAPAVGDPEVDAADDYLGWMNHAVWAEDVSPPQARQLRARYCGEIAFVDLCIGRILDAVESRADAANTVICFFSDHGDHLGDHGAWQKESFFEASCRVPMLVSLPSRWEGGQRFNGLASLTDLFGLATSLAGAADLRDGQDLLAVLDGTAPARESLCGVFGSPGTNKFKAMIRRGDWKYLWLSNGGRELLFNLADDPGETCTLASTRSEVTSGLRAELAALLARRPLTRPALEGDRLRAFAFEPFSRVRIRQFGRGVTDFGQGLVNGGRP
jgi:arylsulfatase